MQNRNKNVAKNFNFKCLTHILLIKYDSKKKYKNKTNEPIITSNANTQNKIIQISTYFNSKFKNIHLININIYFYLFTLLCIRKETFPCTLHY